MKHGKEGVIQNKSKEKRVEKWKKTVINQGLIPHKFFFIKKLNIYKLINKRFFPVYVLVTFLLVFLLAYSTTLSAQAKVWPVPPPYPKMPVQQTAKWWSDFGKAVKWEMGMGWPKKELDQANEVFRYIAKYGAAYNLKARCLLLGVSGTDTCGEWADRLIWAFNGAKINKNFEEVDTDTVKLKLKHRAIGTWDNNVFYVYDMWFAACDSNKGKVDSKLMRSKWNRMNLNDWCAEIKNSHKWSIKPQQEEELVLSRVRESLLKKIKPMKKNGKIILKIRTNILPDKITEITQSEVHNNCDCDIVSLQKKVYSELFKKKLLVKSTRIPDLIGMNEKAAINELKQVGLTLKKKEAVTFDKTHRPGVVVTQKPVKGDIIELTIPVNVELNPTKVKVPDITGMDEASAKKELEKYGLKLKKNTTTGFNNKFGIGKVLVQKPVNGTALSVGEEVWVTINPAIVAVPLLLGMDEAKAKKTLNNWGLKFKKKTATALSNKAGPGKVANQKPKAGKKVNVKTEVVLFLNPTDITVPDLKGMSKKEAAEALEKVGLKFKGEYVSSLNVKFEPGKVVGQVPDHSSLVKAGSPVMVFFNPTPRKLIGLEFEHREMTFKSKMGGEWIRVYAKYDDGTSDKVTPQCTWSTTDPGEKIIHHDAIKSPHHVSAVASGWARLTATYTEKGVTATAYCDITVDAPELEAGIDTDKTDYIVGETGIFRQNCKNTRSRTEYIWKIDDKVVGEGATLKYKFEEIGSFDMEMTVKTDYWRTEQDTAYLTIWIHEREFDSDFSYSPKKDEYEVGETVEFTNTSKGLGENVIFRWSTGTSFHFMKEVSNKRNFSFTFPEDGTYHIRLEVESELTGVVERKEITFSAEDPSVVPWKNWSGGNRNKIEVSGGKHNLTVCVKQWSMGKGKWPSKCNYEDYIGAVEGYAYCNGPFENLVNTSYLVYIEKGTGTLKYVVYGYDGRSVSGVIHNNNKEVDNDSISIECELRAAVVKWTNDDNTTCSARIWKKYRNEPAKGVDSLGCVQGQLKEPVLIIPANIIDGDKATLTIENYSKALRYTWYVNRQRAGSGSEISKTFKVGEYVVNVKARAGDGTSTESSGGFVVVPKESKSTKDQKLSEKFTFSLAPTDAFNRIMVLIHIENMKRNKEYRMTTNVDGVDVDCTRWNQSDWSKEEQTYGQTDFFVDETFSKPFKKSYVLVVKEYDERGKPTGVRVEKTLNLEKFVKYEPKPIEDLNRSIGINVAQAGSPKGLYYTGKWISFQAVVGSLGLNVDSDYEWDINGKSVENNQTVSQIFTKPGTYSAGVKVDAYDKVNKKKIIVGGGRITIVVENDPSRGDIDLSFSYEPEGEIYANIWTEEIITLSDGSKFPSKVYEEQSKVTFSVNNPEKNATYKWEVNDLLHGWHKKVHYGDSLIFDEFDYSGKYEITLFGKYNYDKAYLDKNSIIITPLDPKTKKSVTKKEPFSGSEELDFKEQEQVLSELDTNLAEFIGPDAVELGQTATFILAQHYPDNIYVFKINPPDKRSFSTTRETFSLPVTSEKGFVLGTNVIHMKVVDKKTAETHTYEMNVFVMKSEYKKTVTVTGSKHLQSESGEQILIPAEQIKQADPAYGPHCYLFQDLILRACGQFDNNSNPKVSKLMLYEDGRPLGPAHSYHTNIGNTGKGQFSHWDNYLLFSSSDNSDPRTNGRKYSLACVEKQDIHQEKSGKIKRLLEEGKLVEANKIMEFLPIDEVESFLDELDFEEVEKMLDADLSKRPERIDTYKNIGNTERHYKSLPEGVRDTILLQQRSTKAQSIKKLLSKGRTVEANKIIESLSDEEAESVLSELTTEETGKLLDVDLSMDSGEIKKESAVLLEDNFDDGILDTNKWIHISVGKKTPWTDNQGLSVKEADGVLTISEDMVDAGGAVKSIPFTVKRGEVLKLTRRLRVFPKDNFRNTSAFITKKGKPVAQYRYFYKYKDFADGVYFAYGGKERVTIAWGEWFTEIVTYNTKTGETTYTIPDRGKMSRRFGTLPVSTFQLLFDAYGWNTGHKVEIDYMKLEKIE